MQQQKFIVDLVFIYNLIFSLIWVLKCIFPKSWFDPSRLPHFQIKKLIFIFSKFYCFWSFFGIKVENTEDEKVSSGIYL